MKVPRDLTGHELVKSLHKLGYVVTRPPVTPHAISKSAIYETRSRAQLKGPGLLTPFQMRSLRLRRKLPNAAWGYRSACSGGITCGVG
jgi:hypothetical protein